MPSVVIKRLLIILVLIGAASGAWIAAERWSIEASHRTVELTVEWPEVRQLSAVFRVPLPALLQRFRQDGVTSVALQEQTVHQLVDDGQAFRPDPFTDSRVQQLVGTGDNTLRRTLLAFPDNTLRQRVEQNLDENWGKERVQEAALGTMPALVVEGGYAQFRDLGVGLEPAAQDMVRQAGLAVVARVKNYAGLTPETLQWMIRNLKVSGVHAVIFSGEEVLGNPALIHETAGALQAADLPFGYVEFGKQRGDDRLSEALRGQIIRVETIQGAEFSNLTPAAAVDRFVKAVRERNIRLCYIHLLSSVTGSSLESDEDFVHRIQQGLKAGGYRTGLARPLPAWTAAFPLQALLALGVTAASALLLLELWGGIPAWAAIGFGLLLLGLIGGMTRWWAYAVEGGALLAALVFPTLALTLARLPTTDSSAASPFFPREASGHKHAASGHKHAAGAALLGFLATSLFSLLGALYIIGFLGSTLFMTKTHQFLGIKPAIILPVLAIFVIYGGRLLDPGPPPLRWDRLKRHVTAVIDQPLLVWHVVAFVVVAAVLAVIVSRSGNDSAVGASSFELHTRRILDGWLVARPRTKEFLLGNPALYLAFYAAARGWRRWVLLLIFIGAIGQTSLVNTFCHIHTPLFIALFHAINGIWLGVLIGWACSVVWDRVERRKRTVAPGAAGNGPAGSRSRGNGI